MTTKESVLQELEQALLQIKLHEEIAKAVKADESIDKLHHHLVHIFGEIKNVIINKNLSINYLNQFSIDIKQTLILLPYRNFNVELIDQNSYTTAHHTIMSMAPALEKQIEHLAFNLDFFRKLNFFDSNIVAIGANGSGKTTLSNILKKYLPNTGVIISAQKILIIPTFSGISNFNNTNQKLQNSQATDKSLKVTYSTDNNGSSYSILNSLGGELQVLLDNLLAERNARRNAFFDTLKNGQVIENIPLTKLDKALTIWNSLIQHRKIECPDGINIRLKIIGTDEYYPAHQMSDGEKIILYLIAHVLQAPASGFVICDEPEMYMHKSILKKLWDTLEKERQDCIFVHLTHDLDFATSRTTAKKVWIKSFKHPDTWEIEEIPNNEMPESLLLELLGSRKPILFCEGTKGSIDEKVYNLLFPNFTVTPVESCFSVISYTKAFNRLANVTIKAIGLIDSDYHSDDRLRALEDENIFSLIVAEPENLFFDESFLKIMTKQLLSGDVVDQIKKDCFALLKKEVELQVANYISAKINYYFKDSHVSKGNTLTDVTQHYSKFTSEVHIQDWYTDRLKEINDVLETQDYQKLLSVFNNKGLRKVGNKNLKISDFTDRAINTLQFKEETHDIIRSYFPKKLLEIHNGYNE